VLELYTKDDRQRSIEKHIGRLEGRLAARQARIEQLDRKFGNRSFSLAPLVEDLPSTTTDAKKKGSNKELSLQACDVQPLDVLFESDHYMVDLFILPHQTISHPP
jgi:hypothetical protein